MVRSLGINMHEASRVPLFVETLSFARFSGMPSASLLVKCAPPEMLTNLLFLPQGMAGSRERSVYNGVFYYDSMLLQVIVNMARLGR